MEFHTYQLKSERWHRVVVRSVASTIEQDDIKNDIEVFGHEVATIIPTVK